VHLEELKESLPHRLLKIAEEICEAGGVPYLVGGWVRDAMLGNTSRDYDIEVYGLNQEELLHILSRHGHPNLVGKSYGVINLYSKGIQYDFSFPRLESKTGVGHRAFEVETRPDLDFRTASTRRDFTINAMGMRLPDLHLEDPHGGAEDLQKKLLRHVGPAFSEDPLRVLRAVQFAARFDLVVYPSTIELCRSLDLRELSRERLFEELRKWFMKSTKPSAGLQAFAEMQLERFFPAIQIPEMGLDAWKIYLDQSFQQTDSLPEELKLQARFVALCQGTSDVSSVRQFLDALTLEHTILQGVPALWFELKQLREASHSGDWLRFPWLRRSSLRAPLNATLALLSVEMDCTQVIQCAQLDGIWENAPEPLLTGKMLLGLGLKPGPCFGEWIKESFQLQLDGGIQSVEEALAWARKKQSEM